MLFFTADAGASWTRKVADYPFNDYNGHKAGYTHAHFASPARGWLVAFDERGGGIHQKRTADGMTSWLTSAPNDGGWTARPYGFHVFAEQYQWIMGFNRNLGAVNLNEDLPAPAKISGLVAVNGQMDAPESGTAVNDTNDDVIGNGIPFLCIGSGFVDFEGGLPLTAPGVALLFVSTVGMLFNARPARTFGGV